MAENEFAEIEQRLQAYGEVLRDALAATSTTAADADASGLPIAAVAGTSNPGLDGAEVVSIDHERRRSGRQRRTKAAAVVGVAAALLATIAMAAPRPAETDRNPIAVAAAPLTSDRDGGQGPNATSGDGEPTPTDQPTDETPAGTDPDRPETAAFIDEGAATDETPAGTDPARPENDGGDGQPSTDPDRSAALAEEAEGCPSIDDVLVIERNGTCWAVGPAPIRTGGACAADAIEYEGGCFLEVPGTCRGGEVADRGCIGPKIEREDGVDHRPTTATCEVGELVDDRCLSEQPMTKGDACEAGLVKIGDGCYELIDAEPNCGDLPVADGYCWKPVEPVRTAACPEGYERWETLCYRYEEADIRCETGRIVSGPKCKIVSEATPGPTTCEPYHEDEAGCYTIVASSDEGGCGELPTIDGGCRYPKPAEETWTCDGRVVAEPTCHHYEEPQISCESGRLVDGGRCKIEVEAEVEERCPAGSEPIGDGCAKPVAPTPDCGELDVTPDGKHCKRWRGAAGSGGSCPAGYEPAGDTCKSWTNPARTCPVGTLTYVSGAAKCRVETDGSCDGDGVVEFQGSCHEIVPPGCGSQRPSPWTDGQCLKPVDATEGEWKCETGYLLLQESCLAEIERE